MSVGDESIYDLIPRPPPEQVKAPLYRSKHDPNLPPTASTFGHAVASQATETNVGGDPNFDVVAHPHHSRHAVFGPKTSQKPDPTKFVKKSKSALPKKGRFVYSDTQKPPLPKAAGDPGPTSPKPTKNYVRANATAVIGAMPAPREERDVNFFHKHEYGQVPTYLGAVKQEMKKEDDLVQRTLAETQAAAQRNQPKMRPLGEDERQQLLASLKKKWEEVNKLYQGCTHVIALDSRSKIAKKEQYERELSELEMAIDRLSKKYVFVED